MAEEVPKEEVKTEEEAPAKVQEETMDVKGAIKQVLKTALVNDGLKRGLHESCKVLDKGPGRLCFLAEYCDEPEYKKLVRALCKTRNTPLIMVDKNTDLGEWCGLCKIDQEGKAKKVVKCSCAVITDFGEDTPALAFIMDFVKKQDE